MNALPNELRQPWADDSDVGLRRNCLYELNASKHFDLGTHKLTLQVCFETSTNRAPTKTF